MCGIVAYVGEGRCRDFIVEGLSRLEYRGYDSAGFVCINNQHRHLNYQKKIGTVSELKKVLDIIKIDGHIGMGHSRWATHGHVDEMNAHPHFNCSKSIAVVHNGIVEGHEELRKKLIESGHVFYSSTDTEVVAHIFGTFVKSKKDLKAAIISLINQLHGAYAFVFLMEDYPDQLVLIRKRSPLSIGVGNNEMYIASDLLAFGDKTNKVIFVPDESFAIVKKDKIELYNFSGSSIDYQIQAVDVAFNKVDKDGFEHFMLKEIYEQKRAIDRSIFFCKMLGSNNLLETEKPFDITLSAYYRFNVEYQDKIWIQLGLTKELVKNLKKINLIAAGTSWHAARIAQFFFENFCKIPAHVYLSSEFRYMPFFPEDNNLFIFVSQSGETADTLEALRLVNSFNIPTVAITNVASSTMVREASGFLPMQAGPEVSVASTKAFSVQVSVLYWLANRIALEKQLISVSDIRQAEEDLFIASEVLESTMESYKLEITYNLAKKYSKFDRFIFLGRHISYPFAMEAALKLKEISYIFAQCYPAGELKHGPIALIDDKTPIVIFSVLDDLIYQKLVSNAQEVKARKGHLISFAFEGQSELINLSDFTFFIPKVNKYLAPLAMTGLMQLFVYQITKELGCPIDKPRNLAKSVTVE